MTEQLPSDEEKALQVVSESVARALAHGAKSETVVRQLVKQGWAEDVAVPFVTNIEQALREYRESPDGRQILAKKYARHMLYGVLWAVGGTIVTVWTYQTAASSPTGGKYVVAWGAIVFGIFDFLRGLFGWMKYKT